MPSLLLIVSSLTMDGPKHCRGENKLYLSQVYGTINGFNYILPTSPSPQFFPVNPAPYHRIAWNKNRLRSPLTSSNSAHVSRQTFSSKDRDSTSPRGTYPQKCLWQVLCTKVTLTKGDLINFPIFLAWKYKHEARWLSLKTPLETGAVFLLVLPSFFLHKKEVGRVLLRGQFWRKNKIRRFSKPIYVLEDKNSFTVRKAVRRRKLWCTMWVLTPWGFSEMPMQPP